MTTVLWRFARDCLLSGVQLQRRHIPASSTSIHCSVEESVEHALLFCPFARQVWDDFKKDYDIQLDRRSFKTTKLWLFHFLARCSRTEAMVLAVTFWHVWDERNKLREEGGSDHPSSTAAKIKAYVDMISMHLINQAPTIDVRPCMQFHGLCRQKVCLWLMLMQLYLLLLNAWVLVLW